MTFLACASPVDAPLFPTCSLSHLPQRRRADSDHELRAYRRCVRPVVACTLTARITEDIVRARLRTLGVEEHRFTMESGALPGSEWYIYDVGGSRNNRPMWIPYFDDVQAIIFLAPLAFNLMLEEDPKVNRLVRTVSCRLAPR